MWPIRIATKILDFLHFLHWTKQVHSPKKCNFEIIHRGRKFFGLAYPPN